MGWIFYWLTLNSRFLNGQNADILVWQVSVTGFFCFFDTGILIYIMYRYQNEYQYQFNTRAIKMSQLLTLLILFFIKSSL